MHRCGARPRGRYARPSGGVFPLSRGIGGAATDDHDGSPLIRVRDLKVYFPLRRGLLRELAGHASLWVRAVDGVSFDVKRGEVFCLVGESGCGKTTTGKALLRLVDATEGDVFFEIPTEEYRRYEELRSQDTPDAAARIDAIRRKYSFSWKEQLAWDTRQILTWLGAVAAAFVLGLGLPAFVAAAIPGALVNAGLIIRDPYESLNPKQSVFEIVSEPLVVNRIAHDPEEIAALVSRSLEDAGLRPAEEFVFRFPHELSGGQRQRVSIAAALALEPDFIVADEPVSMLDVSIRTEILQLMMDLREKRGLTYLFITHDLSLAWILADRLAVMYLGKIVEQGTAEQVISHPKHPYTKALISVVPSPDPRHLAKRTILKGERPDAVNIPSGCRFHPRCPVAFEKCGWSADEVAEELRSLSAGGLLPEIAGIQAQDARTVAIGMMPGMSPGSAAANLRRVVSENRDSRLALKGIADIRENGDAIHVTIEAWAEPAVVELEPGNAVACHLVTPPTPTDVAVTA